ncbi:hypothetical protein TELCIR_08045 [Teladorsagia circumcincta]|uniref:Nucleotide-diphospho-sugar transferase domain-containing protein n=1 Tax=Teladorsagia circumcincta TaxID=45464 RepID=A0A2G9UK51_TELCI|nr:hypothetical protein TELCIR_08045 [Teladorsagia circumcincta]
MHEELIVNGVAIHEQDNSTFKQTALLTMSLRKRLLAGAVLLIGAVNMCYFYYDDHLIRFMEFYDTTQPPPSPIQRASRFSPPITGKKHARKIGIVSVLQSSTDRIKYRTAMETMECYALGHNYSYLVLNAVDYRNECSHKDISFQRHCIVAKILDAFEWILFVDADIGVVNENGSLEQFLDPDKDIIFYDRFFNHEVMAGSYLVKRSAFSKRFLHGWADYEFLLPKSFHGRDNGALHMWMTKQLPGSNVKKCEELWNASTDYNSLSRYTVCCRELLRNASAPNIRVLEKGRAWARDGWLTNSHWSPEIDFMFHARKEADKKIYNAEHIGQLAGPQFYQWFDTLKTPVILSECRNASLRWNHDPYLVASKISILRHLSSTKRRVDYESQRY